MDGHLHYVLIGGMLFPVFAAGIALFLCDAARTWTRPKQPHGDPWRSPTLEWLPNEGFGTRSIPQVDAHDPLWQRPSLHDEVPARRHWLPGTSSGGREALITSALCAEPRHLLLPGDSWRPFVAALGTAGFFPLLTAKLYLLAELCGVTAIVAIVMWLWQTDPLPHAPAVAIGAVVRVPVGAQGAASHAWWAMVLLLLLLGGSVAPGGALQSVDRRRVAFAPFVCHCGRVRWQLCLQGPHLALQCLDAVEKTQQHGGREQVEVEVQPQPRRRTQWHHACRAEHVFRPARRQRLQRAVVHQFGQFGRAHAAGSRQLGRADRFAFVQAQPFDALGLHAAAPCCPGAQRLWPPALTEA